MYVDWSHTVLIRSSNEPYIVHRHSQKSLREMNVTVIDPTQHLYCDTTPMDNKSFKHFWHEHQVKSQYGKVVKLSREQSMIASWTGIWNMK